MNHGLTAERGKGATRGFQIEIAFREVRFFLLNYHKSPPGVRNRQIMVCLIYGDGCWLKYECQLTVPLKWSVLLSVNTFWLILLPIFSSVEPTLNAINNNKCLFSCSVPCTMFHSFQQQNLGYVWKCKTTIKISAFHRTLAIKLILLSCFVR